MRCLDFTRSVDGKCMELRINEETSNLEWKYKSEDDTQWKTLVCLNDVGTKDYTLLENIPSIEGLQLLGNIELDDLGLIRGWIGTSAEYEHDKEFLPANTVCHITDDSDTSSTLQAYDIEFDNENTSFKSRNVYEALIELSAKIDALSK